MHSFGRQNPGLLNKELKPQKRLTVRHKKDESFFYGKQAITAVDEKIKQLITSNEMPADKAVLNIKN